jgi:hypothetical protein
MLPAEPYSCCPVVSISVAIMRSHAWRIGRSRLGPFGRRRSQKEKGPPLEATISATLRAAFNALPPLHCAYRCGSHPSKKNAKGGTARFGKGTPLALPTEASLALELHLFLLASAPELFRQRRRASCFGQFLSSRGLVWTKSPAGRLSGSDHFLL